MAQYNRSVLLFRYTYIRIINFMYDFSHLKNRIKETEEWLSRELSQIRTGRATPTILDKVLVESYGSLMPINQVASIASEGPQSLRIAPWDQSVIKSIEKAIVAANLGVSVMTDEKGVRVTFPALTSETRQQFVKMAKQKVEDAKIAIRGERNKVNDDLQTKKKNSEMGEDDMMRFKNEMEKIVKEGNEKLESLANKKEDEITG